MMRPPPPLKAELWAKVLLLMLSVVPLLARPPPVPELRPTEPAEL